MCHKDCVPSVLLSGSAGVGTQGTSGCLAGCATPMFPAVVSNSSCDTFVHRVQLLRGKDPG